MTIDDLCINTLRFLAVDMVQKAESGHPGAPMGMAPMAYVLWDRFLKHNPADPGWPDRDRFILSAGHASALLYSLLYLHGYDLTLDDLKNFRQWESRTPGHPEFGLTPGVEATTGPLGQGFAMGVGMAIAERWLAQRYNRPGYEIIDHYTYALVSDGDLMEGVSAEAASLAGTLGLGKLIYLYDDNGITIEGSTEATFKENVGQRFRAYGWQVIGPIDGMDIMSIENAIEEARQDTGHPSLIICKTVIGYGSPNKQGTAQTHGEPLGEAEVLAAKKGLGCRHYEPFTMPEEALARFRRAKDKGARRQQEWRQRMDAYRRAYPGEAERLEQDWSGELPPDWASGLEELFKPGDKPLATREASGKVLNAIAAKVPSLVGGAADLGPSTKTVLADSGFFSSSDYSGRNFHFGVREHAMGAIANGMSLHRGVIPYAATFFVFLDYMKPAVRLSALMKQGVIYVFTHDSIGLGEDGPTHQPIEQLACLRAMPGIVVLRPADAAETAEAWKLAIERRYGPTALVLGRQKVPLLDRKETAPAAGVRRGAYVLWQSEKPAEAIIIGTGSEVHIALDAGKRLAGQGIGIRVVSMPSWELFREQSDEYKDSVLPPKIKARVSIEAGSTLGWERFVGTDGIAIGIDRFGASAPYQRLYKEFGLTADNVVQAVTGLLKG